MDNQRTPAAQINLTRRMFDAAEMGRSAELADILSIGVDLERRDPFGCTALMTAARRGEAECCKLLLDAGSAPESIDPSGRTALMWAASCRQPTDCVRILLSCANPRHLSADGSTSLMWAAWSGNAQSVTLLLPLSDVDARTTRNGTAADIATQTNRPDIATLISNFATATQEHMAISKATPPPTSSIETPRL